MTMGQCAVCKIDLLAVTLHKSADVSLCPNHAVLWAIGNAIPGMPPEAPPGRVLPDCCLCDEGGENACATIHDFKFDDDRTEMEWKVCGVHARAFIRHTLKPADVKTLIAVAGCQTFLTHDDFYDEDGNALQSH